VSARQQEGYTRLCAVGDVPEGGVRRVEVDGTEVAVVHAEGEFFAVEDRCSHADVALSEGEVEGRTLECWLHGSRFDLRTGHPTGPPAIRPVRTYPTSVEGDSVLVALGTPLASTRENPL